jgi:hypothetical protein
MKNVHWREQKINLQVWVKEWTMYRTQNQNIYTKTDRENVLKNVTIFSFNSEDMKHKSSHKNKHYIQGQVQLKA